MLANIHVYILTAVTIFFRLSNVLHFLGEAFLLPVSIYGNNFIKNKYNTDRAPKHNMLHLVLTKY